MARSNIIEFARSFQESFQRQQAIELQRQREERFDRQLVANADFKQSQLNVQRQRLDLAERQFERGPAGSFGAVQLGGRTGVIDRTTGQIIETAFPSARVAGDTGSALPGRFGVAAQLKESGITGTALTTATQNIPLDLNQEEAEGFLLGSDESVLPFFKQDFLFGKGTEGGGFGRRIGPNLPKELLAPAFKKFLQDTNFATKTPDQQTGILRAFEESLGVSETDGETAVSRDEVDFDLQSDFFKDIIKAEGGKAANESLLDQTTAQQILDEVGGDKIKARALAKERGFKL